MEQPALPDRSPLDLLARARTVAQAYQCEHRRVDSALRPTGLTVARMSVLEVLTHHGEHGASVSEVALELGVHRTSTAAVVRHLTSIGLVTATPDGRDARRTTICITTRGAALFVRACGLLAQV